MLYSDPSEFLRSRSNVSLLSTHNPKLSARMSEMLPSMGGDFWNEPEDWQTIRPAFFDAFDLASMAAGRLQKPDIEASEILVKYFVRL